jgi:hypothetical protein
MIETAVTKYEPQVQRVLSILPGLLTWSLLLSPVWLGLLAPQLIIYYITFLTVLWCYMSIKHTVGATLGFRLYRKEMAMDWMEELKKLDYASLPDKETLPSSYESIRHFILIPVYDEPYSVLRDSFNSLLNQTIEKSHLVLIYTMEEKYAKEVEERVRDIMGENISKFDEVLFYTHPAGIPGEAKGVAGANRTWGARCAVEHLKEDGKDLKNYIFTTIDSDHVLDRQFLARLTHLYLTSDERYNRFYTTALHLFNNNIWEVPVLMRIEANSVTLGSLSESTVVNPILKDTFACYSSALQTLVDADYWDVEQGVDDTLFYWRALFARKGRFLATFHYIPYSADAVQSESFWKTHKSMYKQLLRWGWGAIAFPISVTGFLKNKEIPASVKTLWTLKHIKNKVVMITLVFLMTFGIPIITLINPFARQTYSVYSLPDTISLLLTIALIMLVPITFFRSKIVKPIPAEWPFWKKIMVLLEGPMVVVNLFTFSFFPFIEAQTRLMLGKRMRDLYHTPKVR